MLHRLLWEKHLCNIYHYIHNNFVYFIHIWDNKTISRRYGEVLNNNAGIQAEVYRLLLSFDR